MGTPLRNMEVIHAQIILGVVGALFMLVIGESLARALGIVGAAGLIRYRASIRDPRDAGVMLASRPIARALNLVTLSSNSRASGLKTLRVCATWWRRPRPAQPSSSRSGATARTTD
jgi:hypothetical protein